VNTLRTVTFAAYITTLLLWHNLLKPVAAVTSKVYSYYQLQIVYMNRRLDVYAFD